MATSLCEGEAKEKFVGLLHIVDKKFKLVPLKLKTVRPFVFETITLSDCEIREVDHNVATNVIIYSTILQCVSRRIFYHFFLFR